MICPTCHDRMTYFPGSPSGVWHCRFCGTLHAGSDLSRVQVVPTIVSALQDSKDACLRDDRSQCMVWLLATKRAAEGNHA